MTTILPDRLEFLSLTSERNFRERTVYPRALAAGNAVVLEITWHGTHKAPLQAPGGPIEGTGKTIEVPACMIVELGEGKSKSIRHFFDTATMLQQLGIARAA